ncbi:MAG: GH3 auxin-responsive promoter family protein [Trueperaceae bacterium]|nr:MAG: GH3 auxin-responsive promoter family protein [Trueperaceae bacterium]
MRTTYLANSLWYAASLYEAAAFQRACRRIRLQQSSILRSLLERNQDTVFGKRYRFARLDGIEAYQAQVPLHRFEEYASDVERIANGEQGVLTREPVVLLEPTSGSSSARKLIPYTKGLKAEFDRAIATWMADLFRHVPKLRGGEAYWSVSPVTHEQELSRGGIPIGFDQDSAYLGGLKRHLAESVLAVPGILRLIRDMDDLRYLTLLFLLRHATLRFISVWNPTFLSLLLERLRLPAWREQLLADLGDGTLSPPSGHLSSSLSSRLTRHVAPDRKRAAEVARAFTLDDPAELHQSLWPQLALISCWADAQSSSYARELAKRFPQVPIQPKGLIATEAFISIPLWSREGAALAIRSHFFEFIPEGSNQTLLADELVQGEIYSVVVSTSGGLYRYRLQDLVEVTGFYRSCPLLRFLGKEALVSDHFGEKLNERFLGPALEAALKSQCVTPTFAMVAFEPAEALGAYTLFIEGDAGDTALRQAAAELEIRLQGSFHYRYCRELGQLKAMRVFRVTKGGSETYLERCRELGQRSGDVKPVALHPAAGWARFFTGEFLE